MLACIATFVPICCEFKAAERVDFHFEDMTIPIPIDELNIWNNDLNVINRDGTNNKQKDSDLAFWLNMLGFESRKALSDFLEAPLVKDQSMARELLRSWAGRKILDEISDLVTLDEDSTGTKVFNTLEILLDEQQEVSLLDLLRALPAKVINFDLDGWVRVISNWRDELSRQQNLITDLRGLSQKFNFIQENIITLKDLKQSENELLKINVQHRSEPLQVQVWKPYARTFSRTNWIVFMPGLGGDPDHFRWLARSLSHHGWEVVLIDHPGSNTEAMNSLVEGSQPFPDGAEVFPYRLSDLRAVINAKKEGALDVKGDQVVLMGHSLGALTAFLAAGAYPQEGLTERCNKALDDLSVTNLSRLLQCQIVDVPLPQIKKIPSLAAVIGINSFGNLLWPVSASADINVPVFLTGGTFDLITPAVTEQLALLLSTKSNKFSRVLIIEGASHFSPIRVKNQLNQSTGSDLYQISDALVGSHPFSVQSLIASEIIRFLDNLEKNQPVPAISNNKTSNLNFHILDQSKVFNLLNN